MKKEMKKYLHKSECVDFSHYALQKFKTYDEMIENFPDCELCSD